MFIRNNKPVFGIEYTDYWSETNFRTRVLKEMDLRNDFLVTCCRSKNQIKKTKRCMISRHFYLLL